MDPSLRELSVRGKRRSSAQRAGPRARLRPCPVRHRVPEMRVLQLRAAPGSYSDNLAAARLLGHPSGTPGSWQKLRHKQRSRLAIRCTLGGAICFRPLIFPVRRQRQDVFSKRSFPLPSTNSLWVLGLNSGVRSNAMQRAVYKSIALSATYDSLIRVTLGFSTELRASRHTQVVRSDSLKEVRKEASRVCGFLRGY